MDDCCICLDVLDDYAVIDCGHAFHPRCIQMLPNSRCPLCRKPFNSYQTISSRLHQLTEQLRDLRIELFSLYFDLLIGKYNNI
ncbi:hypothetical protein SGHV118 [Glossina pallidipes salivary gland hypertrophy virus]|uniref:RING-type domain-containing protein n=1 Tax=Glossina hytrovirus (isolate Glossina pallidipes/Ethiopia/Seibersdorf/-) TaxID=379529 RepID=B0YLS2_GHVS|nr:hypothetical protein SGHV118 [Glossina pallidipes salivary gland hypertrophy virus]ABQ08891.1 hypothetical protein SGHV118 [Glossina pallidipes salivary gland hypertrophy virus]